MDLGTIADAAMVQGHGGGHRQIAGGEIHHRLPGGLQLQHQGFRQAVHQGAVSREAHHKEPPGAIAAGHQRSDAVGEHLIAQLTGFPVNQPFGGELHSPGEAGSCLSRAAIHGHKSGGPMMAAQAARRLSGLGDGEPQ